MKVKTQMKAYPITYHLIPSILGCDGKASNLRATGFLLLVFTILPLVIVKSNNKGKSFICVCAFICVNEGPSMRVFMLVRSFSLDGKVFALATSVYAAIGPSHLPPLEMGSSARLAQMNDYLQMKEALTNEDSHANGGRCTCDPHNKWSHGSSGRHLLLDTLLQEEQMKLIKLQFADEVPDEIKKNEACIEWLRLTEEAANDSINPEKIVQILMTVPPEEDA